MRGQGYYSILCLGRWWEWKTYSHIPGATYLVQGELDRRIMDETRRAPWKYWVPLADPRTPIPEKLEVARALFASDERTLDTASIRLRRKAVTPTALVEDSWQRFMFHTVNKIP